MHALNPRQQPAAAISQLNVRIDAALMRRLKAAAGLRGVMLTEMADAALRTYLGDDALGSEQAVGAGDVAPARLPAESRPRTRAVVTLWIGDSPSLIAPILCAVGGVLTSSDSLSHWVVSIGDSEIHVRTRCRDEQPRSGTLELEFATQQSHDELHESCIEHGVVLYAGEAEEGASSRAEPTTSAAKIGTPWAGTFPVTWGVSAA